MGGMVIQAPAKINLHLEVRDKREDGYHNILSLFQAISLCDSLKVSLTPLSGSIEILGAFPCLPEENLIYKAVEGIRRLCGDRRGVRVEVDKIIPCEAGLGGGSSNGAAILRVLPALLGCSLEERDLLTLGASLGSDVPFFLKYPSAVVSGRGEILEPVCPSQLYEGVLVTPPGGGISSADAYKFVLGARGEKPSLSKEELIHQFSVLPAEKWTFFNSFMESYKKNANPLVKIPKLLYDSGAVFAGLSGSGSSVYGLFYNCVESQKVQKKFKREGFYVKTFQFLDGFSRAYVI